MESQLLTKLSLSRGPLAGPGYKYDDDDTADEGGLSPPPSSSVSSINPDVPADEIVVGTGNQPPAANGDKSSPVRVTSDKEEVDMADADEETPASHYPKRKRASVYDNLGEDKLDGSSLAGNDDTGASGRPSKQARSATPAMKGVLLGYWRDSPVPNDLKKHAVIGFPDVRDRLRTRIQPFTRNGEQVNLRLFPIPPGPGGSWTTFDRTVFDDHLVGLDHNEIKEYIKLRINADEETEEEKHKNNLAAIEQAKRNLKANPPPETPQPPAVAYGKVIPENPQHGHRADNKRRRTGSTTSMLVTSTPAPAPAPAPVPSQSSTPTPKPETQQQQQQPPPAPTAPVPQIEVQAEPQPQQIQPHAASLQPQRPPTPASMTISVPIPSQQPQPLPPHILQHQPISMQQSPIQHHAMMHPPGRTENARPEDYVGNLPGQRPTRILVGCWSRSSAKKDSDKHAVYGILGANDMFRVKLVRETMDGRFVDGNFPAGAGALWIAYEEVNFLGHIRDLNRTEMKEYVRVRQYQIDSGETEDESVANETKAVYEAQRRAALNPKAPTGPPVHTGRHSLNTYPEEIASPQIKPDVGMQDIREPRRSILQDIRGRPVSEAEYRQAGRAGSIDPLERTNSLARREVHKMEAAQMRQERGHGHRGLPGASIPTPPPGILPSDNRGMFQENIKRLNGVWNSQEAQRQLQSHPPQQQPPSAQLMQMPPQQPPPPQPQQAQQPPPPLPSQQMIPGPNMDEVKVLGNVTYTRKQNGPFIGKLVSRGEIITIDGEDYVEYRVLTKPTFF